MPVDATLTAAAVALLGGYCDTIDHQRYAEWAELFTPDGRFEFPPKIFAGREALEEFAANSPRGIHVSGAPSLTRSGGTLNSVSSWTFINSESGKQLAGYYHDQFVETEAGWRFLVRRVELLSPRAAS